MFRVLSHFQPWVVLGYLDLEDFVDKHMENLTDWERNFKSLKIRGRDAEKLPSYVAAVYYSGPLQLMFFTVVK